MFQVDIRTLTDLFKESIGIEAAEKIVYGAIKEAGLSIKSFYSDDEYIKICEVLKKSDGFIKSIATVASSNAYREFIKRRQTEEALRESYNIISRSPVVIFLWKNIQGLPVEFVSDNVKYVFGYTAEEFTSGKVIFGDIIYESDRKKVLDEVDKYSKYEGSKELRQEYRIVVKGNAVCWIDVRINSRYDEKGRITHYQGTVLDISDRKWTEDALRESEQKFRDLTETISDWIWEVNAEGVYTYVSPKVKDILGYEVAEVLDKTPFDFMPQDDAVRIGSFFKEKVSKKESFYAVENKNYHKDGRIVVLETNGIPIFDEAGRLKGYRGIDRDITGRKQAEEALAAEKERLTVTLRSIGDGVITTDIQGKVILVNRVAEALTGWSQEEAAGQDLAEVFCIKDKRSRQPYPDIVQEVLSKRQVIKFSQHVVLTAKYKREYVIDDSAAPIFDREIRIVGVVIVFRDISERRTMQDEILKAQKLESLGVLAGGIAHDFNNILAGILTNISLAKMNIEPSTELHEIMREVETASLRAKDLTQQLLTFSKGGSPVRKAAAIEEIVKDSVNFILRGSNIKCEFSITAGTYMAYVDTGQISQVIQNIIINARDAMPEGGIIEVKLENVRVSADSYLPLNRGKYVKIVIKDHGYGIPNEHLAKVFDPYFTTKAKGSGLGLTTAYAIIKRHDGYITLESKIGEGTVFYIYLPASDEFNREESSSPKETGKDDIPVKGRILVMDDEEVVRKAVGHVLVNTGYEVEFANDGKEAVQLYAIARDYGRPFDAVILDLTVPGGMGGKETIVRLLEINPLVKAVVSSGYSTDPIMGDYKKFGFKGMVNKPCRAEELINVLKAVMNPGFSG